MEIDDGFQSCTALQNRFGVRGLPSYCISPGFIGFPLTYQMFDLLISYLLLCALLKLKIILLDTLTTTEEIHGQNAVSNSPVPQSYFVSKCQIRRIIGYI